ncbi:hypothetical protein PHMEG_0006832 [Phytophthora megakarya]|uniref:DDE-1 domain-containing protein n=1 Tax=Phytophthora megakarya TaxID=4795 RepID=A0A225WQ47_9STRA|nr:hypothetical protein PHMEG_0006832 [Phytophthora megakarya]
MTGKTTIDVHQASATGENLRPLLVFDGVPGGPVSQEVWNPAFGDARVDHTVQKKHGLEANYTGCRLLLLDGLKVHKMDSIRAALEEQCTQVEFVPSGITGLCQPMDVAVMKPFKDTVRRFYLEYHMENPFPSSTTEKWELLLRIVAEAWEKVPRILPTGPRDAAGLFRFPEVFEDAPKVKDNE